MTQYIKQAKKISFLISFLLLFSFFPVFAKTVRVGYYKDSGNFMSGNSEADPKGGYSYEYMQTIASYTGWSYEYVYAEWDELYEMLLNGDIDILSDVSYTEERKNLILYSDYVMGQESYYLYTNNPDLQISSGDYSTWKGIKIGVKKDGFYYDLFMDWQKDKNLECEYVKFSNSAPYTQMFNDHEFDMLLEIDMVADPSWNPVVKVGSSDFYLAVTKSRPDILEELNYALADIFAMNPYYNNNLWLKYFSEATVTKSLSPRESLWLDNHSQIIIGCHYNDLPFSAIGDGNVAEGFVVELMDYFSNNLLKNSNCEIMYAFYDDNQKMLDDLKIGNLSAVVPVVRNLNLAEKNDFVLSESISSVPMGFAYKDFNLEDKVKKIAIPDNLKIRDYIEQNYPGAQIVIYKSYDRCMEAVYNGEVDGAIFNIYKMRGMVSRTRRFKKINIHELSRHFDMSFMLTKENTPLLSMLNKMLMLIPAESSRDAIEYFSIKEQGYTRKNFVRDYLGYLILFSVVFIFVLFALIFALQKIRDYIDYDVLTGLRNRHHLEHYIQKSMNYAVEGKGKISLLLFDLDNFKYINDTYGHAFGDKVLVSVADAIRAGISSEDYAFRWGGEEFLIITQSDQNRAYIVAERIRKVISDTHLKHDSDYVHFTVTIGVSSYEKGTTYKEMFRIADENLYKGKRNGKNQVVITV